MITVTTETVIGHRIVKVLGMVEGNTVRARNIGRDIVAVIKSLFGGEIIEYSELLPEARTEAMARMIDCVLGHVGDNVRGDGVVRLRHGGGSGKRIGR